MAHRDVVQAFRERLAEVWTRTPIIFPNETGEAPIAGTPFLAVQFPLANNVRWAVNSRTYREEGGARLILNVERDEGANRSLRWLEELAEDFRDRQFTPVAKPEAIVTTQAPGSPFLDDSNDASNYFQSWIVVPYYFNYIG